VAYLICPDCRMPNEVGDGAIHYQCYSCFAQIGFETCEHCGFVQSIATRWGAKYTCAKCDREARMSRRRAYGSSPRAREVKGYGFTSPKT
jgi:hypothetical protein